MNRGCGANADQDTTSENTRLPGRPVGTDPHDHEPPTLSPSGRDGFRQRHGMERQAKPTTFDAPRRQEWSENAFDGRSGDHQRAAVRARRGHPQKASRSIENRPPFLRARDRQVERYTVIDPATTQAMPSRAESANDAHPHDRPAATVGSEHQGERPEARLDCSWESDFDGLFEPERDNICAAITGGGGW